MKKVQHIATVSGYNDIAYHKTHHPLVSIIDFSKLKPGIEKTVEPKVDALSFGFYAIFLKKNKNCDIRYGRNYYDYQESTLIFIAPGQIVSIEEDGENYQPNGYALLFHPDLIRGTSLAHNMKGYTFFSYDVYEALHLSEEEEGIILEGFLKVESELKRAIDKHSKKLIVSNIELLLNYCDRFYDRQFVTRDYVNAGILEKFERVLNDYFASEKPQIIGFPSVAFFADQLHFSANYFGDLIKKETGKRHWNTFNKKLSMLPKKKYLILIKQ